MYKGIKRGAPRNTIKTYALSSKDYVTCNEEGEIQVIWLKGECKCNEQLQAMNKMYNQGHESKGKQGTKNN